MSKKVTIRYGSRCAITSRKNAERYHRHGRARKLSENLYEFIDDDARHMTVQRAAPIRLTYDDGMASLAQVEGLPVAGKAIRLFTGRKPAQPPREDRIVVLSVRRLLVSA